MGVVLDNLNLIIDSYYKRYNFTIENNNLNKKARSYKSQLNKFLINKDKQLGTFIIDAKLLFKLEGEEDLEITNPRLKNRCVQYYYLTKKELIAYIGFRTKLRKNMLPQNPQISFFIIYIMEIINDLYTSKIYEKINLIKQSEQLFKKNKKFQKVIIEAYEFLYLQNDESFTIDNFKYIYNIKNIFEGYSESENIIDLNDKILNEALLRINVNETDKYLIQTSFDYILDSALINNFYLFINGDKVYLNEALSPIYNKYTETIHRLYTYLPLDKEISLYKEDGKYLELKNGILKNYNKPIYRVDYFSSFLETLREKFRELLQPNYKKNDITFREFNSYFSRNKFSDDEADILIKTIIESWIKENPFCLEAYDKNIELLKYEAGKKAFSINYDEVNKVRKKSVEIQNKIIIEDERESEDIEINDNPKSYFEKLKQNKEIQIAEYKEIETVDNEYIIEKNSYSRLINNLSVEEYEILKLIIDDDIHQANKVAEEYGCMLSLIIEKINIKSVEEIEDIIIDNEKIIEDYRENVIEVI